VTAFFHELDAIPNSHERDVAKAAQAMIRETLAVRRAKANARKPKLRHGPHMSHRRLRKVRKSSPLIRDEHPATITRAGGES
jgi:hypothetical protein